jgi:hypothetical protein
VRILSPLLCPVELRAHSAYLSGMLVTNVPPGSAMAAVARRRIGFIASASPSPMPAITCSQVFGAIGAPAYPSGSWTNFGGLTAMRRNAAQVQPGSYGQ